MEKGIKTALADVLKERVSKFNDGLFASHHASNSSLKVLMENGIRISGNTVLQHGAVIAKIRNRYSSRKMGGCYRMLQPIVEEAD